MLEYYFILVLIIIVGMTKNYQNKLCFFILFIFSCIRYYVGWDYGWYYNLAEDFEMIQKSLFWKMDYFTENGFQYSRLEFLNKIFYKITWYFQIPQIIIMIYSFIILIFFYLGIKKIFKTKCTIEYRYWLIFYTFPLFYFNFLSLMRQGCIVSIAFYSYLYIKKRKKLKFIICIFLGSLIHKSLLIFFPSYFLTKIKLKREYIIIVLLLGLFSSKLIEKFLLLDIFKEYHHYILNPVGESGKFMIFIIIILNIVNIFFYKYIKNENKILLLYYTLGSFLYISLYKLGQLGMRVSIVYLIFIIPILIEILNIFKFQKIINLILTFISFIMLTAILYKDYTGKYEPQYVPYQTIFSKKIKKNFDPNIIRKEKNEKK